MKTKFLCAVMMAYLIFAGSSLTAKYKDSKKMVGHYDKRVAIADFSGNLEYDFSRSAIRSSYYEKLNKLAQYLTDNNAALTLRGYADSIGSFKGNWKLSEKRAIVVKRYLVQKGVTSSKIVTTAFGSTEPVSTNQTAQGRQKNRRVEIKITNIN